MLAPDVGGGFGPKGAPYPEEVLVAAAALRLGRPVKWVESRREDFAAHRPRPRAEARGAHRLPRATGRIAGIETAFLADVGAYPPRATASRSTP